MRAKIITILFFLFLISCNDKYKEETIKFKEFLEVNFSKNIEQNKIYILMPMNLCGSCVDKITKYLYERKNKKNNYVVILSDNTSVTFYKPKSILKDFDFIEDSKNLLVKKGIIDGNNIGIYRFRGNQLYKITPYIPYVNDELICEELNSIIN